MASVIIDTVCFFASFNFLLHFRLFKYYCFLPCLSSATSFIYNCFRSFCPILYRHITSPPLPLKIFISLFPFHSLSSSYNSFFLKFYHSFFYAFLFFLSLFFRFYIFFCFFNFSSFFSFCLISLWFLLFFAITISVLITLHNSQFFNSRTKCQGLSKRNRRWYDHTLTPLECS